MIIQRHCSACGKRNRPLKWIELWGIWCCWPCQDRKVRLMMVQLEFELQKWP